MVVLIRKGSQRRFIILLCLVCDWRFNMSRGLPLGLAAYCTTFEGRLLRAALLTHVILLPVMQQVVRKKWELALKTSLSERRGYIIYILNLKVL